MRRSYWNWIFILALGIVSGSTRAQAIDSKIVDLPPLLIVDADTAYDYKKTFGPLIDDLYDYVLKKGFKDRIFVSSVANSSLGSCRLIGELLERISPPNEIRFTTRCEPTRKPKGHALLTRVELRPELTMQGGRWESAPVDFTIESDKPWSEQQFFSARFGAIELGPKLYSLDMIDWQLGDVTLKEIYATKIKPHHQCRFFSWALRRLFETPSIPLGLRINTECIYPLEQGDTLSVFFPYYESIDFNGGYPQYIPKNSSGLARDLKKMKLAVRFQSNINELYK